MELKQAFGLALRNLRMRKKLTQEDFSEVSSRTFLSSLERGVKGPTLEKIDGLASVLQVHPLTVLVACYLEKDASLDIENLFDRVRNEL